jgi:hypothetical protein
MYIHAITHNNKQAFAITEAQGTGGARAWGIWRKLRLIRFDVAAAEKVADELSKTGHRWEKSFDVLEDIEVDVRNAGPASGYGKAFAELERQLEAHAGEGAMEVEGDSLSHLKALVKH